MDARAAQGAVRTLQLSALAVDFCSNDYLGIARGHRLSHDPALAGGSTGSRLLAGNYPLLSIVEGEIAAFHEAEAALMYNSGYDANVGLLSGILQKEDTILYDHLSHASIRDGIRLSFARAHAFRHNDMEDLERLLQKARGQGRSGAAPAAGDRALVGAPAAGDADAARGGTLYVVTETLFSMDGDTCPLDDLDALCRRYGAWLIVDEAHATGVIGERGEGLVQPRHRCFARVHTFGKALGCHGAVVLGSADLKQYLVNFSRPLIYTTALPPVSADLVRKAYGLFPGMTEERAHLYALAAHFQEMDLPYDRLKSTTPIQAVIVPGNENVRRVALALQTAGLDVRPILYPTVPQGTERLRIVLHAFNSVEQVELLGRLLKNARS
jgi:8-amino-7-oxononanoate synthase